MAAVFRQTDFVLGKAVTQLEEEFAAYCGVHHAVSVSSGTAALELALRALGIGVGDEVITTANTFIATAFAISQVGATPVFVDIDPNTYELDVAQLPAALTPKTRAIIPVHLYGHPVDMTPLLTFARRHQLLVLEDACQAHGARYKGACVGSFGNAAAFSFYPSKNLGGCGEGGMVVTNDDAVAAYVRTLRDQGQRAKYDHILLGHNHRMDTLQAALLRVKLPHLDEWNALRRAHAARYTALLVESGLVCPATAAFAEPVYHLYVVRSPWRDALQAHLQAAGVATGIHYPIPIHHQPVYARLGYSEITLPITEQVATEILSLPMYPELADDAILYVTGQIHEFEPREG